MDVEERLGAICRRMRQERLELLVGVHDGVHAVEKPNPVLLLCGFKSLGPAAAMLRVDGRSDLVVTPAWDGARAVDDHPGLRVIGTYDLTDGIRQPLRSLRPGRTIGVVGLSVLPSHLAARVTALLPDAVPADDVLYDAVRTKTESEIECAREAVKIAERGYRRLVDIARPGAAEDDLAVELKWYMKSMGAEDVFLLLSAGPRHRGCTPSTGRRLQRGDIVLIDIMPSYRGQLARYSRTISIGPASDDLAARHKVIVEATNAGIDAAVPGATMADICRAVDAVVAAAGNPEEDPLPLGERRGHGLGFSTPAPGDITLENTTVLEPDMLLAIQASQFFPETGYLACGDTVLITPRGPQPLTLTRATLATVGN